MQLRLRRFWAIFIVPLLTAFLCTAAAATGTASETEKSGGGDRELGEYLSSQCTSCHQLSGKVSGGIPSIIGWDQESFIAVMDSYKKKERENKVMQNIAGSLSKDDIAALAAYFAAIPVPEGD